MGMVNFYNKFRELTNMEGNFLFLFGARLRVGAFLNPLVEGGMVSSSGGSWGVSSLGNNFTGTIAYYTHRWQNSYRCGILVPT